MTDAVPSDFEKVDGWDEDCGVEVCPTCDKVYSPNQGYVGDVYDTNGRHYDYYSDTDPDDGPFFCDDCWSELVANAAKEQHKQLTDFK